MLQQVFSWQFYKKNPQNLIWIILIIAFLLRVAALITYGLTLTLNSDDQAYIRSAVRFLETGMITYHIDEMFPTVHIMPGQPLLLAFIFLIFGTGDIGV